MRPLLLITLLCTLLGGCAAKNPYYDPSKPHHTATGFKNNYAPAISKSTWDVIKWKSHAWWNGLPKAPQQLTPVVAPNLTLLQAYGTAGHTTPTVTWIGHASTLVQAGGLNVLTDPVFSERASPVQFAGPKRARAPGIALKDLPPIDVVLISHNHNDHLDIDSVVALDQRAKQSGHATQFLVPLGVKPWMAKLGITNVVELDWWQSHQIKQVEFHFTPSQHWSARGLTDRSETLWGAWAVFCPEFHWYFSGDTGYSKDFIDTREHFASRQTMELGGGFDLALIAIGAYEPRWFMEEQHIDPAQSVQIHKDIAAKQSIGIHWGTFELTDEALDQPPKDLALAKQQQGIAEDAFIVLKIGETKQLQPR